MIMIEIMSLGLRDSRNVAGDVQFGGLLFVT